MMADIPELFIGDDQLRQRWLLVRANVAANYIDYIHKVRTDNLLKEVREQFRDEYPIFL